MSAGGKIQNFLSRVISPADATNVDVDGCYHLFSRLRAIVDLFTHFFNFFPASNNEIMKVERSEDISKLPTYLTLDAAVSSLFVVE